MAAQGPGGSAKMQGSGRISRWVCDCQDPPVLLATHDGQGKVNIKARDRYWTVRGVVWARCPLCGTEHYFDPDQHLSRPTG